MKDPELVVFSGMMCAGSLRLGWLGLTEPSRHWLLRPILTIIFLRFQDLVWFVNRFTPAQTKASIGPFRNTSYTCPNPGFCRDDRHYVTRLSMQSDLLLPQFQNLFHQHAHPFHRVIPRQCDRITAYRRCIGTRRFLWDQSLGWREEMYLGEGMGREDDLGGCA